MTATARRAWTPEDVEELECLTVAGLSAAEIAEEVGRTTSAIYTARTVYGISARGGRRNVSRPRRQREPDYLRDLPTSRDEDQVVTAVPPPITRGLGPITDREKRVVRERTAAGGSVPQIAAEIGRSPAEVFRIRSSFPVSAGGITPTAPQFDCPICGDPVTETGELLCADCRQRQADAAAADKLTTIEQLPDGTAFVVDAEASTHEHDGVSDDPLPDLVGEVMPVESAEPVAVVDDGAWEDYTHAGAADPRPLVTLRKSGEIGINAAAFELAGRPRLVRLRYDRTRRRIGIKPAVNGDPLALSMMGADDVGSKSVSGSGFYRAFGLEVGATCRYVAELIDGMLVVDLGREAAS